MTSSKGEGMDGWTGDADLRDEPDRHIIQAERDAITHLHPDMTRHPGHYPCATCPDLEREGMNTGDLVTFSPRAGESAEGVITRVWDKPASDPYITVCTTGDEGRTFTRCSSAVVKI
jgi:hypothetical protein